MFSVSQYQQLRPEERMTIAAMKLQGASVRAMAKLLGRSPSTISRELRRNVDDQGGYDSHRAAAFSVLRRRQGRPQRKLDPRGVAWGVVLTLLSWKWAPQQIAATLRRVFPDDPSRHVSHETIYTAIYALPPGNSSAICWLAFARARARACRAAVAPTAVGRSPRWSASMCAPPR